MKGVYMHEEIVEILNGLSQRMNQLYGYVQQEGENLGEPAINSGPCGLFANTFYHHWNKRFDKMVNIVFIMVKNSEECWHVLIRLPDGLLFDGGCGVHGESKYQNFLIEDMSHYDLKLLEARSYGLNRTYPRYCPNFSITEVITEIEKYLNSIDVSKL